MRRPQPESRASIVQSPLTYLRGTHLSWLSPVHCPTTLHPILVPPFTVCGLSAMLVQAWFLCMVQCLSELSLNSIRRVPTFMQVPVLVNNSMNNQANIIMPPIPTTARLVVAMGCAIMAHIYYLIGLPPPPPPAPGQPQPPPPLVTLDELVRTFFMLKASLTISLTQGCNASGWRSTIQCGNAMSRTHLFLFSSPDTVSATWIVRCQVKSALVLPLTGILQWLECCTALLL